MARILTVEKQFPRFFVDADSPYTWGVKDRTIDKFVVTECRDHYTADLERQRLTAEAQQKGEQI